MTGASLAELLTRAKVLDDPPHVIREIQTKLDKAVDRHKKELHSAPRKTRTAKNKL